MRTIIMSSFCAIVFMLLCMATQGQISPQNQAEGVTSKPIVLNAMQEMTFDLAVNANNLLILKFEPDQGTLDALKKEGLIHKDVPLTVKDALQLGGINVIEKPMLKKLLEVSIKVGTTIYKSEMDDDQFTYIVKLTPASISKTGKLVIKNLTKIRLSGEVKYKWRSITDQKRMDETEINSKVKRAFDEVQNTDMVYLMGVMFERYLNNFPAGKGNIDEVFENNLQMAGVTRVTIQALSMNLKKYQDQINAKVSNKSLLNLKATNKLETSTLKQINLIQMTPESEKASLGESNFIGHYEHSLSFLGIKSHRCADDVGWEPDCDQEEGYVGYYCFSPNLFKVGTSPNFNGMVRNSERFLYKEVFKKERLQVPMIFVYQVIEDDPDGPSKDDMVRAITSSVQAVVAGYNGDWLNAIKFGYTAIETAIKICQALTGGPDDTFPIYMNMIDEIRLKDYTLGTTPPPEDRPLFGSEGSYRGGVTFRVPKIYEGNSLQWSLAYSMIGTPVNPIAELYADANYGGIKKQLWIDGFFTTSNLAPMGDNVISSVRLLDPKYELVIYDANFSGTNKVVRTDYNNLTTIGFDNKISSVTIRKRTDLLLSDLDIKTGKTPSIQHSDSRYAKLDVDLNASAGGDYIYTFYIKQTEDQLKSSNKMPINGIKVVVGKNTPVPTGYTKINIDLNQGAGGDYIYLCYRRGWTSPIKDIIVIQSNSSNPIIPAGYVKENVDLNKGAGGYYLYFCYSTSSSGNLISMTNTPTESLLQNYVTQK